MYQSSDEISLRELYLIFRSGLVAIIITTVVVGAAAFLYLSIRPKNYEASAIVQVSVSQVPEETADVAWILRPSTIGVKTYESIANSINVLSEAFDVSEDDVEELQALSARLKLDFIEGDTEVQGRFTVAHIVNDPDPETAPQLANAWAEATARAVTAAIGRSVSASVTVATTELEERDQELRAARESWAAFAEDDERVELTSRLSVLQQLESQASVRVSELVSIISSSRAQYNLLATTAPVGGKVDAPPLEVQLNAMMDSGVLDQEQAGALQEALTIMPSGLSLEGQELIRVITQARLESLASSIAGYAAELEERRGELGAADGESSKLRTRNARLEQEAAELKQRLSEAQSAYNGVANMSPLIRLQQDMLAHAAAVFVPATRPIKASGGRFTITLAAALVAGLLATLVVFLRAAIREPDAPTPHGGSHRVSQIDPASGGVRPSRATVSHAGESSGDGS